MANDITPPIPPIPPLVQEGKQGTDAAKREAMLQRRKNSSAKDEQTLDEWAEDHTEISLGVIELQVIEDVNTLLKRYTDEIETEEHDEDMMRLHEGFHPPMPNAYETYKKMTHNFKETPHQVRSPFMPFEPQGLNEEEFETYYTLKKYWDDVDALRKKGIEHIEFRGEENLYETLERAMRVFINSENQD